MLLDLIGFGIVLPILPLYSERHGATPLQATLLVAVFSLAQFVFAPIWGRLSDRVGRKPLLVLSLVGTALGSLLTGLANSLLVLYVARAFDGASGGSASIAQAAVADMAEPQDRPRLMGLIGAAFGLGFVLGPALGASAGHFGARAPFFVAAVLAGANAIAAAVRLRETRVVRSHKEVRADRGNRWASVRPGLVMAFVATAAFSAFEATFSLFGDERFALDTREVGLAFTAIGLALALVHIRVAPRVVHAIGSTKALAVGVLLTGMGLVVLAPAQSLWLAALALLFVCVGAGCSSTALNSWIAERAHPGERGSSFGALQSAQAMARIVGPGAGGLALTHLGAGGPFWTAGAVMVAAAAAWRSRSARTAANPA